MSMQEQTGGSQPDGNAGTSDLEVDVLVVGGGPVGLAVASELGFHGVAALLIDAEIAPPLGPRAQLVNIRSMEHLRRWGIADDLRAAAVLPEGWPSDVVFCTSLSGEVLRRFPAFTEQAAGVSELAPEGPQRIPQFITHQVLRRHVESLPSITCRWGWRATEITQDASRALVSVVDVKSGLERQIRARFVVGCDGGASGVRAAMGVKFQGPGALSQQLGIFFDSPDLIANLTVGPGHMHLVANPDAQGLFGTVDGVRSWYQSAGWPLDADLSALDPLALVRRAIGPAAAKVTLELAGVQPWTLNALVAERYREGRLFVAGDAAHLIPPTGGHNMNTGIGDAVDIGWKLAAVIEGWGGPCLLDSYDLERRPVAERNLAGSVRNSAQLRIALADALATDTSDPDARRALGDRMLETTRMEWVSIGVVLGYRYAASPVIVPDGSVEPPDPLDAYGPVVRPGHRAPHVRLPDGGSLHDRLGPDFSLLPTGAETLGEPAVRAKSLMDAAARRGMPVRLIDLEPAARAAVAEQYGDGWVLVRPDQHIGWRAEALPADPGGVLDVLRGGTSA